MSEHTTATIVLAEAGTHAGISEAATAAGAAEAMHATVGHETEHKGGMPQLRFEDFAPQLIWLAITFGILYLLMSRVALPRVAQVMEARRDRIANDLDQAAQLKAETDAAIEAYEKALAEARAKAHQIAAETREALAREMDEHREKLEAELETRLKAAEARIAETKARALANVREVATEVAGAVVAKLGLSADSARIAQAVDAELNR